MLRLALAFVTGVGCGSATTAPADSGTTTGFSPEVGAAPASDVSSSAPAPVDPAVAFYDEAVVQDVRLTIAQTDALAMLAALPERIDVHGTLRWGEIVVPDVAVRFKGNSSAMSGDWKRGYVIDTDTYVDGQRFLGLEHMAFDNGIQFGGLWSEVLVNRLLRAEGVVATRANHARLTVNGEAMGVFVNVERIDKKFLKKHFAENDGNLYKCNLGGPGDNLVDQGDDPLAYATAFEVKTNDLTADWTDVAALARFLRDEPDETFAAALAARFDLDSFLTTTALLAIVGAFDQYTGFNPHNYYLYFDPTTGRATYLAHDLDVAFADNAFGTVPVIDGWNVAWPVPRTPRPLLERILRDDTLRARYQAQAQRLLDGPLAPAVLDAALDELYARIGEELPDDPSHGIRVTVPTDTDAAGVIASMKAFIKTRTARALADLANPPTEPPSPVFVGAPPDRGPTPGDLVDGAPTHLVGEVVDGTVSLSWDVAPAAAASIVQRCTGLGCDTFVNHIGLPIDQGHAVIDTAVTSGTTYRYRVYALGPTRRGGAGTIPTAPIDVVLP